MWNLESLVRIRTRYLGTPAWLMLAACLLLAAAVAAPAVQAQESETAEATGPAALVAEVEAAWDVLPVQNGVVLKPRDPEASFRAVEVSSSGVAVDGEPVDDEELDLRLGEQAELIRRLRALDPGGLRSLFTGAAEGAIPGEPPPPPPVEASPAPRPPAKIRSGEKVVFADSLVVAADESAKEAVVIGGSLTVDGRVERDAAVIGGTGRINGEVDGDVAVVGGTLHLGPESRIGGDLTLVGSKLKRDEGAVIEGQINEVGLFGGALDSDDVRDALRGVDFRPHFRPWRWVTQVIWEIVGLAIVALLMCVVVLLGEGSLARIGSRLAAEPWKAAAVGFVSQVLFLFLLPLTVLLLIISIIGIPLLLLVPIVVFGVVVAAFVGYTAAALQVGRLLEDRFGWNLASPYAVVLAGLLAIQVWGVLAQVLDMRFLSFLSALVGLLAFLLWYAAVTSGFGALLLTWFERRRAAATLPPAPTPPLPPMPTGPEPEGPQASHPEAGREEEGREEDGRPTEPR